jgi:predicted dienelactone hydrolase
MEAYVGARVLEVNDAANGVSLPVMVMYPGITPSSQVKFGSYTLDIAMDADMAGTGYPLVILSHGTGSTPYAYRSIAAYLARQGFVVALPEHYGNNRNNNELADSDDNLLYRPRHIRLSIDAIAADADLGGRVDTANTAIIGHSMGGYTALAVAGGRPWTKQGRQLAVESDPRVKALVLMAPAIFWYLPPGALGSVDLPMLVLTAEQDPFTPGGQVMQILNGVEEPSRIEHHEIDNAGHFSFLSPFPEEMIRPDFPPSQDPEGFDREAFHYILNRQLVDYLNGVMHG